MLDLSSALIDVTLWIKHVGRTSIRASRCPWVKIFRWASNFLRLLAKRSSVAVIIFNVFILGFNSGFNSESTFPLGQYLWWGFWPDEVEIITDMKWYKLIFSKVLVLEGSNHLILQFGLTQFVSNIRVLIYRDGKWHESPIIASKVSNHESLINLIQLA